VFAEGTWRGLHTVGVRDSIDALNGIGHAAVITDPQFRAALAAHAFTLDPESGEVAELSRYVGPFSARAAQIGGNIDRHEAQWREANPGEEPGPRLRRWWDSRACARLPGPVRSWWSRVPQVEGRPQPSLPPRPWSKNTGIGWYW